MKLFEGGPELRHRFISAPARVVSAKLLVLEILLELRQGFLRYAAPSRDGFSGYEV